MVGVIGIAAVLLVGAGSTTHAVAQSVTYYLGGTCLCATTPTVAEASSLAGGFLVNGTTLVGVGYPAGLLFSLDAQFGKVTVTELLDNTDPTSDVVLAGLSQGAIVLNSIKQSWELDGSQASDLQGRLVFVTLGDPQNSVGGITTKVALMRLVVLGSSAETPFDTIEIVREYDGFADWPDHYQPLAVTNALMGIAFVHTDYGADADPSTPGTLVTQSTNSLGGTTTHYVVPTAALPVTALLRAAGIDTTALDAQLRPVIDSAYNARPTLPASNAATTDPTASGDTADEATDAPDLSATTVGDRASTQADHTEPASTALPTAEPQSAAEEPAETSSVSAPASDDSGPDTDSSSTGTAKDVSGKADSADPHSEDEETSADQKATTSTAGSSDVADRGSSTSPQKDTTTAKATSTTEKGNDTGPNSAS